MGEFYAKRFCALIVVVIVCGLMLSGCGAGRGDKNKFDNWEEEKEEAIRLAKLAYEREKSKGTDFTDGPCISNDLMDGWVADVAHDPRQEVDNDPKNQCSAYGVTADHFVELDENGELIRTK